MSYGPGNSVRGCSRGRGWGVACEVWEKAESVGVRGTFSKLSLLAPWDIPGNKEMECKLLR